MTPVSISGPTETSRRVARVWWAPFTWHTRFMVRSYARHVFVILVSLSSIALSIDLPSQLARVFASTAVPSGTDHLWQAVQLVALRAADIAPRFISLACFLGVLWTELAHTTSRERIVIWNSGRSPLQSLTPLMVVGVCMGFLQIVSDVALRPATIAAQMSNDLGDYGERFHDPRSKGAVWFSRSSDLLQAVIEYGPPVILHDVTLYRLNPTGHVLAIYMAQSAVPGAEQGSWVLEDGTYWRDQKTEKQAATTPPPSDLEVSFHELTVHFDLNPVMLGAFGIDAELLPQKTLTALSNVKDDAVGWYRTTLQMRYAGAFLPLGMTLVSGCLSMALLSYRMRLAPFLTILLVGYLAHLATRTCKLLGEHGYIDPVIAGWAVPVALIGGSVILLALVGSTLPIKIARALRAHWHFWRAPPSGRYPARR